MAIPCKLVLHQSSEEMWTSPLKGQLLVPLEAPDGKRVPRVPVPVSMEIAFSSYEGEKLGYFLKEYDPNFRNIIMKEIEKRKTNDFLGNDNRNQFLNAIRDSMNEFLISKEEDPIIFNAVFKTFVIKQG